MQYLPYLDPDFVDIEILMQIFNFDDTQKLEEPIRVLQSLSLVERMIRTTNYKKNSISRVGVKSHRLTQDNIKSYFERHKESKDINYLSEEKIIANLAYAIK